MPTSSLQAFPNSESDMAIVEFDKVTLTVPEVARLLRISRGAAYGAVRRGEIPHLRFGKSIRISRLVLERLLNAEGQDNDLPGVAHVD